MEVSSRHAKRSLENLGYAVAAIPTASTPRADLRAFAPDGVEYIFEAKRRDIAPSWRKVQAAAATEGIGHAERGIELANALASTHMEAARQLRETPSGPGAFRLFWVYADHDDRSFVLECVRARLLGLVSLSVFNSNARSFSVKPCYFYERNDFIRLPFVHGAILAWPDGATLFANPFADNALDFRASHLYNEFRQSKACCDPRVEEDAGRAFLVDKDCDWDVDKPQWRYLERKYGAPTSRMRDAFFDGLATSGTMRDGEAG